MIKENIVFLKEFIAEFQNTGACLPTSRWAAEALISPITAKRLPQRILEVGPGTGSVTIEILPKMMDGDELTICEINPRFMEILKKRLSKNPYYIRHRERIRFYQCPMQELPEDVTYDIIVSAMPFLNFSLSMVQEMFDKFKKLSSEKTVMTYYEYIGLRSIGKSVGPKIQKRRFKELDRFFRHVYEEHEMRRKRVWLNVLPINIYTIRLAA